MNIELTFVQWLRVVSRMFAKRNKPLPATVDLLQSFYNNGYLPYQIVKMFE
jgi:hypothetical protein